MSQCWESGIRTVAATEIVFHLGKLRREQMIMKIQH